MRYQVDFLEAVFWDRGSKFPQGSFAGPEGCRPLSVHFMSGHGGLPACGETILSWRDARSTVHLRAGSQHAGGRVVTGPSPWSQAPREETTPEDAAWSSLELLFGT